MATESTHRPEPAATEPAAQSERTAAESGTQPRPSAPRPGQRLDLDAFATAEESLFSILMFLLRRTQTQTGQIPTHTVLDSTVRAFDVLLTSGKLPTSNDWDRSFLVLLLVALEQTATRHGRGWLDEIITHVRQSLRGLDDPDDDSSDDGPGNGEPDSGGPGDTGSNGPKNSDSEEGGSDDGRAGSDSPSDGSNGQIMNEWRGSPTSGMSSVDTPLDAATTRPVKKKK